MGSTARRGESTKLTLHGQPPTSRDVDVGTGELILTPCPTHVAWEEGLEAPPPSCKANSLLGITYPARLKRNPDLVRAGHETPPVKPQ